MHVQLRHKKVVQGAIVLLALLVMALVGYTAWRAQDDYRAVRAVADYTRLADVTMQAIGNITLERGLTAAVLGAGARPDPAVGERLALTRRDVDRTWAELLALTGRVPDRELFERTLAQAREARRVFEAAREWVSSERRPGDPLARWMQDSTAYVATCLRLGDLALQAADMTGAVVQIYAVPRKIVWEMNDQAGQERGLFAYYIGARVPVPAEQLDQLGKLHSLVRFGLDRTVRYFETPGTDPRIAATVSAMQENYLGRFELVRVQLYAAVRTGQYPLTASEWVDRATDAIRSIQGISTAIGDVTREKVERARRTTLGWLGLCLALFAGSLALVVTSLTRVRLMVENVFQQKELAEVTMDSIGDAVITTDAEGRVEYINPVAEGLTGWTNAEAKSRPLKEVFRIVNGYDREPKENPIERCLRENRVVGLGNDTVLVRRDGSETVIEDSAAPVRDREGKVVGAVMVFYDVAAQRGNTHLLSYHTTHDRLTGLVNRAEFERRLQGVLEQAKSRGGEHALCYLDLDQFKVVNDTCGHAAGDQLLRSLTKQFQTRVRDTDTLSHLSGDEFGLLLASCPLDKAVTVAESLLRLVHDFRFEWHGSTFHLGASIGVVPIAAADADAGEVLAKADAACYAAKEKGRNRVQVYEPGDLEFARRHGEMQWVSRLTQAMEQDRLRLWCQPIVPLGRKGVTHYEILVRMVDEGGKLVMPGEFITAAERYSLMPQIDRWITRRTLAALAQVSRGRRTRRPAAVCNINLSGASLGQKDFLDELRGEIERAALPPGALCFEITETAAVANLEQAMKLIRTLKGLGCTFALDDFGTGLSSFAYLKEMPVDFLKIGGQFVKEIARDPTARTSVQAMNTIGHTLHMRTVAEHVSSPAILKIVREMGVDYAQGFAIAKPIPVEECMLKHYAAPPGARQRVSASSGR